VSGPLPGPFCGIEYKSVPAQGDQHLPQAPWLLLLSITGPLLAPLTVVHMCTVRMIGKEPALEQIFD